MRKAPATHSAIPLEWIDGLGSDGQDAKSNMYVGASNGTHLRHFSRRGTRNATRCRGLRRRRSQTAGTRASRPTEYAAPCPHLPRHVGSRSVEPR